MHRGSEEEMSSCILEQHLELAKSIGNINYKIVKQANYLPKFSSHKIKITMNKYLIMAWTCVFCRELNQMGKTGFM